MSDAVMLVWWAITMGTVTIGPSLAWLESPIASNFQNVPSLDTEPEATQQNHF